jgi:hypothetical protein
MALSKPLFAVAPAASWVLLARFTDRLGKGTRAAPRDALIGDLAPSSMHGAAYGLRQSLDTIGAFIGPLLAIALMAAFDDRFRWVFWCALAPGFIAVTILVLAVHEPRTRARAAPRLDQRRLAWRHHHPGRTQNAAHTVIGTCPWIPRMPLERGPSAGTHDRHACRRRHRAHLEARLCGHCLADGNGKRLHSDSSGNRHAVFRFARIGLKLGQEWDTASIDFHPKGVAPFRSHTCHHTHSHQE